MDERARSDEAVEGEGAMALFEHGERFDLVPIPPLVLWRADDCFPRLEGAASADYAAAPAANWRQRLT